VPGRPRAPDCRVLAWAKYSILAPVTDALPPRVPSAPRSRSRNRDREGRYDEAVKAFAEARALVDGENGATGALETLATIEIGLASVAYRRAAYPDAIAHATAAAGLGERAGLPALLAHADVVAGVAHTDLGHPEAVPLLERSIAFSGSTAYTVFRVAL